MDPPPYWVNTFDPKQQRWIPVSNLNKSLGAAVPLHTRMGTHNSGIYYTSYQQIAHLSDPSSHHFQTDPEVTWSTRRLALRYRGGGIYTAKLAKRYGKSPNDTCPICKTHKDSQNHLLGGCPHDEFQRAYTARHHSAGALIRDALLKHGNHRVLVQSDVAAFSPTRHYKDPVDTQTTTPPSTPTDQPMEPTLGPLQTPPTRQPQLIPPGLIGGEHTRKRPDLILADRFSTRDPRTSPSTVLLVEIKYGQDTRLELKRETANTILTDFATSIATHNPTCTIHKMLILLGVGGRIPQDVPTQLRQAGIPASATKTLCNALNTQAVQWLATIVRMRRRMEPD